MEPTQDALKETMTAGRFFARAGSSVNGKGSRTTSPRL